MKEYRCTRNALYRHDCLGHDDLGARQGHYIQASTKEEAWQKMAIRFPEETNEGFRGLSSNGTILYAKGVKHIQQLLQSLVFLYCKSQEV